jgi:hypothetical protein
MQTILSADDTVLPPGDAFEVHRQLVVSLFFATLMVSTILGVSLYFSNVTALMVVAASGALGGFVSALRRLYTFQRVFPVNFFKNWRKADMYLIIYSMIPSLVGAIAAVILYLIFASELTKSDMFPKFHLSQANTKLDDFQNFVANWQPILPSDYAKALVWSFLAGFSERFVPDLLEHFATSTRQKLSSEEAPYQPPTQNEGGDLTGSG